MLVFGQYFVNSVQPNFPEQVIFSPDHNKTLIVIDEINQQTYLRHNSTSKNTVVAYVMEHMRHAEPNSSQAKHYVQLIVNKDGKNADCSYLTYWEYSSTYFHSIGATIVRIIFEII